MAVLLVLASSGSVKVDEPLTLKWRVDERTAEFTIQYDKKEGAEIQWWSVKLIKDSSNKAEVFLVNSTGLDLRYSLLDCLTDDITPLWHEAQETVYLTAFSVPLSNATDCIPIIHGDLYHVSAHYGEYHGEETVETRRGDNLVPMALTNQFTDQEEMSDTLNYAVGVAAFLGLLYIAA